MRKIENPSSRGGSATDVVTAASRTRRSSVGGMLSRLHDDQNLRYLTERVRNFSDLTDARLNSVRLAVQAGDALAVADVARALTDATAKLGSVRMMRLAIALQMLGRRRLFEQAAAVVSELETEFSAFKENLIPYAG